MEPKNLIYRTNKICKDNNIPITSIIATFDINTIFKGCEILYGTGIKFRYKDNIGIMVSLVGGWNRKYIYDGTKGSLKRIAHDLKRNSFNNKQISQILGVCMCTVSKLLNENHEEV